MWAIFRVILLAGQSVAAIAGPGAQLGGCRALHQSTSLLSLKMARGKISDVTEVEEGPEEAEDSATSLYHGNLTDHYKKEIQVFEPNCQNCSAAEEALVTAFRTAHAAHTSAQELSVALLTTHKEHAGLVDQVGQERAVFASRHDDLDKSVLTPESPESAFEGFIAHAMELQEMAKSIQLIEVTKVAKKSSLDAAQAVYDSVAKEAQDADGVVVAAQDAANKDCGHLVGGQPLVPAPAPGPPSGTDLGFGHPVVCSSGCQNYYGNDFLASNGVIDETYGAHRQTGGLAHTHSEQDAWVEVDFEKEFRMGKLTIWNGWQWGCCMGRINPFRIVFFDESHSEVSRVTGLQAKTEGDGETPVTLQSPVVARFVRIQLDNHHDYLHIAELRAYAA